jgi:hypothetical protein
VQETPAELRQNAQSFQHISNIIQILRQTEGFDPLRLVTVGTQLIAKPETQQLGQKVAEGLVQKALTRLIRNVLLDLDRQPPTAPDRRLLPSS